jgi:PHD/YefM family antitoxin component YafN of YafNO toxin-antitoxin module
MTATTNSEDTHQYVTDADGNRKYVLLPVEEYEALLEDLRDIQLVQERRGGETISLKELKHQLGRE